MAREMKDSGIAWIGEIPNEWDTVKFKYLHNGLNTGESIDKDFWTTEENETVFYTAGLIPIRTNYKEFPIWKYTRNNDILLARNGTPYVYFPVEGACYTDHIIRAVMKEKINRRYVQYCLQQSISSVVVDSVSIATWSASLWNEQTIPWPDANEQRKIVSFLDAECAHIDAVMEQTRASIEEYKKLKQAVITQAVTKGIRPNRPMKDSGVDWIGEIPVDWEMLRKLSYACCKNISYGIVKLFDPDDEHGVKVLRCSDIREGIIDTSNIRTVTQEISNEYSRTILDGGEVLINVRGTLGGCAVVPKEMKGYNIAREVAMVSTNNTLNNRYLMYYFLSTAFLTYEEMNLAGSVYIGLNIELLSACPILLPNIFEQVEIANYLDNKCSEINALIAKKECLIQELEKYKKTIVFEYVTGKKGV